MKRNSSLFMALNWNRILSGLVAAFYIFGGLITDGAKGALIFFAFVILPLACIWFGDTMGGYIGPSNGMSITAPSPGIFVCIAGWILLMLPVFWMIF
jgi:hypothetical protein